MARTSLVAVVAVACGLVVTALLLSGLVSFSNANETETISHDSQGDPSDHLELPIDIKHVFDERERGLDALGSYYILIDEAFVDEENACDFCIGMAYTPGPNGAATLAFKRSEPVDLTQATTLAFDVRGETGSERIRIFALGVKMNNSTGVSDPGDSGLRGVDFAFSREIELDSQWQSYDVNIEGFDTSQVTYAFAVQVLKGSEENQDQTIYLDELRFEAAKPGYTISLN